MFSKELFLIIGTILTAILTLISINPIYSVIGLIIVFILSGSYLLLLSINFIGLSYFIIYVGAISILFLFAVMMLDTKYPEFTSLFSLSFTKHLPLAAIVIIGGLIFYILLNKIFINYIDIQYLYNNLFFSELSFIAAPLELNFIIEKTSIDNLLIGSNQIKVIGYSLYTHLSLWLIITSFILLLAMIGPIILCFKSFNNNK